MTMSNFVRKISQAGFAILFAATASTAESRSRRLDPAADPASPYGPTAQVSPDGKWIVWIQRSDSPDSCQLMASRRWEGSSAMALTPARAGTESIRSPAISARARRVAWIQNDGSGADPSVWSAPLDGSAGPVRLSPDVGWSPTGPVVVTAGDHAVFTGDFRLAGLRELWSAPLDGSRAATRLHADPEAGGAVAEEGPFSVDELDGRALFRADLEADGHQDLWVVAADGSASPIRLNPDPGASGDVEAYGAHVTPDGSRVVFVEGAGQWGVRSLWSAKLDASQAPVLLTGPSGNWPRIGYRKLDPSGDWVTFRADSDGDLREELWISPTAGPGSETRLLAEAQFSPSLTLDSLSQFHSPSGSHLTFGAALEPGGSYEIWTVPVDGSGPPVRRNPEPEPGSPAFGTLLFSEGVAEVVFFGKYAADGAKGLWSAAADSTTPPTRLDQLQPGEEFGIARSLTSGPTVGFTVVRDSSFVDLWAVRREGGEAAVRLYEETAPGNGVRDFRLQSDGRRIVFETGVEPSQPREIWEVPSTGPATSARKLHPELAPGASTAWLRTSVDGHAALFIGDFDAVADTELWIADEMIFRADQEWGSLDEWSLVGQ